MRQLPQLLLQSHASDAMQAFTKKLESFVHAPLNPKEAQRIETFAQDSVLVNQVATVLQGYKPWEMDKYTVDIIGYWYSVSLLCYRPEGLALQTLSDITDAMITQQYASTDLLQRTLSFFPGIPALQPLQTRLAQYFKALTPQTDAHLWAQQTGLQVPTGEWMAMFHLTPDGEMKFAFQLSEAEKQSRVSVIVTVYGAPRGDGQSWDIRLQSHHNHLSAWWQGPAERNFRFNDKQYTLQQAPSLLQLGDLLRELEQRTGNTFVRKMAFSTFSKGIKNKKAVDAWLAAL